MSSDAATSPTDRSPPTNANRIRRRPGCANSVATWTVSTMSGFSSAFVGLDGVGNQLLHVLQHFRSRRRIAIRKHADGPLTVRGELELGVDAERSAIVTHPRPLGSLLDAKTIPIAPLGRRGLNLGRREGRSRGCARKPMAPQGGYEALEVDASAERTACRRAMEG